MPEHLLAKATSIRRPLTSPHLRADTANGDHHGSNAEFEACRVSQAPGHRKHQSSRRATGGRAGGIGQEQVPESDRLTTPFVFRRSSRRAFPSARSGSRARQLRRDPYATQAAVSAAGYRTIALATF